MRDNLEKLQVTLQQLKKASLLKKAGAAEAAILAAVVLITEMVAEIEKLQTEKEHTN